MKKLIPLLIISIAAANVAPTTAADTPKGWFPAGTHPKEYEMKLDRSTTHGGKASASLKSVATQTSGFGNLMQSFAASAYKGQRVRLSGFLRAKDVADWGGLWMRVDGPKGEVLSFDNMQQRALKGTRDWQKTEIVLDVPETAEQISIGLLLSGKGQVWMDDLTLETVGKDVPVTGASGPPRAPERPKNLDFEE